ncbi:hypothetical protein N0V86_008124 [Didymella sp. IMI 355093]|nr:hypothetical protein N0V86_008124 [Didymella sp. IMI 355093]
MSSLLSLPREIRDQIIGHVLVFSRKPPKNPAHETESRLNSTGQDALRPPKISPNTYNASGLLGTNVQLRDETNNRLRQLKLTYTLDVMVVDHELWPTWTCCPARISGAIDKVNITLRFFSNANDPYMVHVARTCGAILQGRKWATTSMHPLALLYMHVRAVCLQPGSNDANSVNKLCFEASTRGHLDWVAAMPQSEPLPSFDMKLVFGKHRSLWNSFRSIRQYPFAGKGEEKRLELVASLKIMVLLFMQEAWEGEYGTYTSYVGPLGIAFRGVQDVQFVTDGQDLAQLTSSILPA